MTQNKLEEKEKLEAEIARSLSVVKMKEAYKQIEEVEKSRKKSAILSINERLSLNLRKSLDFLSVLLKSVSSNEEFFFNFRLSDGFTGIKSELDAIVKTYKSIRFDLQRNIDVKNEDFDKLFPEPSINFETCNNVATSLNCLNAQMRDMQLYCQRLL